MKLIHFTKKALLGACSIAILTATPARAGEEAEIVVEEQKSSTFDDIWRHAILYKGDENTFIQKLAFTGRLQTDAAFFYPNEYDEYESLHWRRFRAGFKMQFLNHFTLHSEADFNLNAGDVDEAYGRLTDTYVAWQVNDSLKLKVGKISAPFTFDGHTSSKKLIRPERSNLSNNLWFPTEYHSGVSVSGDKNNWEYLAGIYSSQSGQEFGDFNGGMFGLVSIGYDFSDAWDMDKALLRLDYVYNDENANNSGTRNLSHVVSFNSRLERGKWGLITDIASGEGYGSQSNLFAIAVMPYYDFTNKVQGVMSYNFVTSDDPSGVRLDRYENRTTENRFDEAHEFFAGINYYIYGHKLKWQNGVEYTTASNSGTSGNAYNGWGFTSAFRLSW